MRPLVTVVDYGMGNLFSVQRAFHEVGADVVMTDSPSEVLRAERLVLPGVGAFATGMEGLRRLALVSPLREFASSGRPFLGICLGMQMMMTSSQEFGQHEGLNIIQGIAEAIPATGLDGKPHKIPHIGWNHLVVVGNNVWENTVLHRLHAQTSFYFVHSFSVVPSNTEHRLADCKYNGRPIAAVIQSDAILGSQFHPEKSGDAGLDFLRRFLQISETTGTALCGREDVQHSS